MSMLFKGKLFHGKLFSGGLLSGLGLIFEYIIFARRKMRR